MIALEKLGKDYRFKTTFNSDSDISNNTLQGDLYFMFRGNPTFKHIDIDFLFSKSKRKDLKNINGNIIVDSSYFDNVLWFQT